MKARVKKTGEIVDVDIMSTIDGYEIPCYNEDGTDNCDIYNEYELDFIEPIKQ